MLVFPPTADELLNGYSAEKLAYLEAIAIRDVTKLVFGRKYALVSNGYYVGMYSECEFISHEGRICGCHGPVYKFLKTLSNGHEDTDCRSSEFIEEVGLYEIID
jgi:hypothetical protein